MVLYGILAELMSAVEPPIYRKNVKVEKGQNVSCVPLQKALYGTLRAALLFYEKLLGYLQSQGFDMKYDPCVVNKVVNVNQMTIVWHVDDFTLSHVYEKEVTCMIEWMMRVYRDCMQISRGYK